MSKNKKFLAKSSASESEEDVKLKEKKPNFDSSEEEEDEKMTKEDSEFLKESEAENEKGSESENGSNSSDSESPEELSEDDLDLIEENFGKRRGNSNFKGKEKEKFKRLRRKNEIDSSEEENLDESDEKDENGKMNIKKKELSNLFDEEEESEIDEEDDLRDFIEEEDDEEFPEDMEEALNRRRRSKLSEEKQFVKEANQRRRAIVDDREDAPKRALSSALESGQISKEAWEEMMEIFGDGTDYLDLVVNESDDDEPIANDSANDTTNDIISSTVAIASSSLDVPERLTEMKIKIVEDDSEFDSFLQKESAFIAKKIQKLCSKDSLSGVASAILTILRFFHHHGLEVPFIATYRKEYYFNFFTINEIWIILGEDLKYRQGFDLKKRIREKLTGDDLEIVQSDLEYINLALEQEWEEAQLQFIHEFLIRERSKNSSKKHQKTLILLEFAHKIVPAAARFAENVRKQRILHGPLILTEKDLESEAVEVMAKEAAGSYESALSGAVNVLAEEFGSNPQLFAEIRNFLISQAELTVTPTTMGAIEIAHDPSHYLQPLQFVSGKNISAFIEDQGLAIARGLEAKLINVDISYGGKNMSSLLGELKEFLPGNEKFRDQVFEAAWSNYWKPRLNRLVLQRLRSESETWTASFAQFYLQEKLMISPLNLSYTNLDGEAVAVTSVNFVNQVFYIVDLDKYGRVLRQESLKIKYTIKPESALSRVLNPRTPHVVICGEGQECVELYRDLRDSSRSKSGPVFLWGCDDTARIYQNSSRASREFPECASELKYAVAVGRRMLDPVVEFAMLTDDELLELPLHTLQAHLPRALRLSHLHRALVNVINLLGVAVNELVRPGSKQAVLSYVSGLGPVKAANLSKKLGSKCLNSRAELVTQYEMGRRTFTNCAGFIKITPEKIKNSNSKSKNKLISTINLQEPLDGTRIHPESYELARKMAADALELDDPSVIKRRQDIFGGDDEDDDEDEEDSMGEILAKAINQIIAEPKKLDDLVLPEYAKEIERLKNLPKHKTLEDIKSELQGPFPDPRAIISGNTINITPANQIVKMITGKDEDWWYYGREVRIKPLIPLTRKLAGLIDGNGLTVGIEDEIPRHVKPGVPVTAYLTKIDLKRLIIDVCIRKPENLEEMLMKYLTFDPFYDFHRAKGTASGPLDTLNVSTNNTNTNCNSNNNNSQSNSQSQQPRQLSHPAFKSLNREQAEKYLELAPVGEFLIRPSSQKRTSGELAGDLTLTWKSGPNLFAHVPLGESDRPPGQDWILGRTLSLPTLLPSPDGKMKVDRFEDLDEIVGRRIEPVVSLLQEAQACPKFYGHPSGDSINDHLKKQSQANPGRTPYCITLATDSQCGHLMLSHPGGSRQELIRVDPRGYALTDPKTKETKIFERIEKLVDYFKKHYSNFSERIVPAASTSTTGASTSVTSASTTATSNADSSSKREDPRASKYQQFAN